MEKVGGMKEPELIDKFVTIKQVVSEEAAPIFRKTGDVAELLVDYGLHERVQEELWVITLDGSRSVRTIYRVAQGGYHDCDISLAAVLSPVFLSATDRFVVAHNHPSGELVATGPDIELSDQISQAADLLGLMFEDHIIMTPQREWYSMKGNHQLRLPTTRVSGRR